MILPSPIITFGPDETCSLDTCPLEWSIYTYRPSMAASIAFIILYSIIATVHVYLGYRWRSWGFMTGMLLGCTSEIIGYIGRIMLWYNPFSFVGFMIQIICLTVAPVFYTASIYVTLSKTIVQFAPDLSRFKPQLLYYTFIPIDVVCLILQAAGGAISTESSGNNNAGVDISLIGLGLQVVVLSVFDAAFADYMSRFLLSGRAPIFSWRLKAFFSGLVISALLILARCAYRVAELQDGYRGSIIKKQTPFIILEGVAICVAAVCLCFGHPGLVFNKKPLREDNEDSFELVED